MDPIDFSLTNEYNPPFIMKTALRILLPIPVLFSLVSWSPTDPTVIIGTGNDIDGYIGTSPTSRITPFRGFLSGNNNFVGSTNTGSGMPTMPLAPIGGAAVIGNSNKANLYYSVLAGESNQLALTADPAVLSTFIRGAGVFGNGNVLSNGCANLLVSGSGNTIAANTSLVTGYTNTLGGATIGSSASNSAVIGIANQIAASQGWAIGNTNTVTNTSGVALGTGLIVSNDSSIALGKWNAPMGINDLLVIGRGTSSSARATALTIQTTGAVVIPGAVTISGNTSLQGATASNLTVSGLSKLQGLSATSVTSTGGGSFTTLTGSSLNISGSSTLGTTNLPTGNLTLTNGNLTLSGPTSVASFKATLATSLSVSGATTLATTTASALAVTGASSLGATHLRTGDLTLAEGNLILFGATSVASFKTT